MQPNIESLLVRKHLLEQLAYEEIRHYLSQQFLEDPVQFMYLHGKRPEDLNGQYLRSYYESALSEGIEARQSVHKGFNSRFNKGHFFHG